MSFFDSRVAEPPPAPPASTSPDAFAAASRPSFFTNPDDRPPAAAPPQPPRKPRNVWRGFAALVLAIAVAAAGFAAGRATDESPAAAEAPVTTVAEPSTPAPSEAAPVPASAPGAGFDAAAIGELVIPSVTTVQVAGQFGNGSGSGVIYDDQGHIVTNNHVVDSGSRYQVVLADGRVYEAELVGADATTDLAVLRIDAADLTPITPGDTSTLSVGDPSVAVGSPLGLDGGPSLTVGVISAFGREVQTSATTTLFGMLQTDAPITQGSSGGALVDSQGRLIGITTAVGVSSVGIEGIGFATPVEIVERVADEIIATGAASQPFLGITGITEFEPLGDGGERPVGVSIESVQPGSAAAAAGLGSGEVITSFDGETVDTMDELVSRLRRYGSGDAVRLTVRNASGEERTVDVTLGSR